LKQSTLHSLSRYFISDASCIDNTHTAPVALTHIDGAQFNQASLGKNSGVSDESDHLDGCVLGTIALEQLRENLRGNKIAWERPSRLPRSHF
jgi:hypothetical protein